jgi:hypothetical protein
MPFDTRDRKGGEPELPGLPQRTHSTALALQTPLSSRHALTLSVPTPILTRDWRGRLDVGRYADAIGVVGQVAEAITNFNKKQVALEESYQEVEKVQLERPYALAMHQMRLQDSIERLSEAIEQQRQREEQATVEEQRRHELHAVEFDIALYNKQAERDEARERAAAARGKAERQERAALAEAERDALARQAEAEDARRTYKAARARGLDGEGSPRRSDNDDAVPPEVQEVSAQYEKIRDIRRWAEKERAAILAQVGGDESRLSPRGREELEDIEQRVADAEERVHTAAAAGLIFPSGEEE